MLKGYNSVTTFAKSMQAELAEKLQLDPPSSKPASGRTWPERFTVPEGYDERLDHFVHFFTAIREKNLVYENAAFAFQAAAPALLCNDSLRLGRLMSWDPAQMKVVS